MLKIPTVAIVDDDGGVRTSLTSLVRSLGYQVRAYTSAREFLDDKQSPEPDCMIADIQMPHMTGDRLQAVLSSSGRSFPIIFMTAFPSEAVRDRVMAAGARDYLEKPPDSDVIARRLADLLGPR
ncbi:response regulator receiver protein [Parvibaculum lavamentivorans DS-1]|uniref:Response regulator receiver protein n=1 Tax=Parvibaculum lavamentivorans (strain DS-1 / DSM 13023 / NCIMB 13966) TaxID=402881 RepID=A7HS24_PARL1|nr:response regulator [Parvibaculum lavamentivorans]ABS62707.1 response regulator receiver protein [Parvibaculum lavamentivorans DS-1]